MSQITKINLSESISKGKLVYKVNWLDKLSRFNVFMLSGFFLAFLATTAYNADPNNSNDRFFSYACMALILPTLYVIYRKITEKRLTTIVTNHDKNYNRELLLKHAKKTNVGVFRKNDNYIILNDSYDSLNPNNKKTTVCIFMDNQILFSIIKFDRIGLPCLTSHLFFKHDIKKLIQEETTQLQ